MALSPRRPGPDSPWALGQLPYSCSRHHGRCYDRHVRAPAAVVALLRFDGDGGVGDRRICYVPARSHRGERGARAQVLAQESGQSLRDLRTMGLRRDCHPCSIAAACAHGSIPACGGRNAISGEEISGGANAWPNLPIHDPGVFGRALWKANHRVHRGARTPCHSGDHRGAACGRHCGSLFLAWTQDRKMDLESRQAFLLKCTVP